MNFESQDCDGRFTALGEAAVRRRAAGFSVVPFVDRLRRPWMVFAATVLGCCLWVNLLARAANRVSPKLPTLELTMTSPRRALAVIEGEARRLGENLQWNGSDWTLIRIGLGSVDLRNCESGLSLTTRVNDGKSE